MKTYKILKPFKFGASWVKPGDPDLQPEANDGRDWRLLERIGYVREAEEGAVPPDSVKVASDAAGNRSVATAEGQVPVVFDLDRAVIMNAEGQTLFDATRGIVFNGEGDVLYDASENLVDVFDGERFVRSLNREYAFQLSTGRVLGADGDTLFDPDAEIVGYVEKTTEGLVVEREGLRLLITETDGVYTTTVLETAGSEDSAPPAQPGDDEGTSPGAPNAASDSETPLGGEAAGGSEGTENRLQALADAERADAPPQKARAEVIEGEGGWFRIEAGGAKIGNSTRDRAEADRRAAEYNEE